MAVRLCCATASAVALQLCPVSVLLRGCRLYRDYRQLVWWRVGTGKCTAVFDMEGYSSPGTVMPAFHVRHTACAPPDHVAVRVGGACACIRCWRFGMSRSRRKLCELQVVQVASCASCKLQVCKLRTALQVVIRLQRAWSRTVRAERVRRSQSWVAACPPASERRRRMVTAERFGARAQTRLEALYMAQQYYPESLQHGFICFPPMLFNVLWHAVQPFLDPVTKCASLCRSSRGRLVAGCCEELCRLSHTKQLKLRDKAVLRGRWPAHAWAGWIWHYRGQSWAAAPQPCCPQQRPWSRKSHACETAHAEGLLVGQGKADVLQHARGRGGGAPAAHSRPGPVHQPGWRARRPGAPMG